jgi:hypothetical protein
VQEGPTYCWETPLRVAEAWSIHSSHEQAFLRRVVRDYLSTPPGSPPSRVDGATITVYETPGGVRGVEVSTIGVSRYYLEYRAMTHDELHERRGSGNPCRFDIAYLLLQIRREDEVMGPFG